MDYAGYGQFSFHDTKKRKGYPFLFLNCVTVQD